LNPKRPSADETIALANRSRVAENNDSAGRNEEAMRGD